MNLESLRGRFPGLGDRVYLNAASEGPLPAAGAREAERAARLKERPWEIDAALYYEAPAELRSRLERLVNAPAGSIALVQGTSAGIGIAASRLPVRQGDEVLVLESQFPSNLYPWRAAVARGAVLRTAARPPGSDPTEAVLSAIGPRTRIVAVDWVSFVDGATLDLDAVGAACRARGAIFVLDAAQGLGALTLDLARTPVDILAAPSHKWLLGPEGAGLVYVAPSLLETLQSWNSGWLNLAAREGFRNLLRLDGAPPPDATRFETGTPAFSLLLPWAASLDLLAEIGPGPVQERVLSLASRLAGGLRSLAEGRQHGALEVLLPPRERPRSGIVAFRAGERSHALYRELARAGIVLAMRESALRASPHVYNTEAEIDLVLETTARFL